MYDEVGQLAWKMQLDVFGVPSFEAGSAEDCPWRWPGQYDDLDASLFSNLYRYYDTQAGHFVSVDPIRLAGGPALRAYPVDSIVWSDPTGLMPWVNPVRQGHHIVPHTGATHFGIRPFNSQFGVPGFYFPEPYVPGSHELLHGGDVPGFPAASGPAAPLRVTDIETSGLTSQQWLARLEATYRDPRLSGVRGDLRIVTSSGPGEVLARNVTPAEAWDRAQQWARQQLAGGCR
jgi:RHS repeat-associated protein